MKGTIYLTGSKSSSGDQIWCPLPSSCILFFVQYCQSQQFEVVFITDGDPGTSYSEISMSSLKDISVRFLSWEDVDAVVKNVCLPAVHQAELSLVRAGLCVVLRHIIKIADVECPAKKLIDLLGFRQGSMRMCSEVSGWTKLCEVDLSDSVSILIQSIKKLKHLSPNQDEAETNLTLPLDLLKLESHFTKKCKVHNDDKKRRAEISRLKKLLFNYLETKTPEPELNHLTNSENSQCPAAQDEEIVKKTGPNLEPEVYIENISISSSQLKIEHLLRLPHGVRKVRVVKDFSKMKTRSDLDIAELTTEFSALNVDSKKNNQHLSEGFLAQVVSIPGFAQIVEGLTYLDVEYMHTYSEGPEMTLADLILFVYVYLFLEKLDFDCLVISEHLPNIMHWMKHMASLTTVTLTGQSVGWNMSGLTEGLRMVFSKGNLDSKQNRISFKKPKDTAFEYEEDMELSRCAVTKHRALKPEVYQALKKLEEAEIKPCLGHHPQGVNVTVDWDNLPSGVHPREGDVPEKRTRRKCQQLENLVTAVQTVAKPGHAIVDFCSGGGHLGIILAYLLPQCQVYLVENKEESLLKVCSRLESLAITNVTLYQCNIDYFTGKFDVGVCLHACGSATDMVQELCLNAGAAFVICPCCYGSIRKTHLLTYPRSIQFQDSSINYKDFLTLGHAADQTEFNIALEEQGRECMNLVDSDRAAYARELGYHVTLCSLQPLSCTPKNNLIVGIPS
ncbi:hypothetical protein EGW08_020822 [Elysia chlorotica]|uniref:Uncharacterized protein n=1 Tax=Elysia chlorotica TaxID=188477 RepID=A0A3S1H3D2_ELYCH|nr:hypothetical protein EGW08_020822 [Elysia chlorotica]